MLKVLGIIAAVLVAGIGGFLTYAASRPDSFRVERRIAIKAPPEKIMPQIADLKAHQAWSPWEKKDPAMKRAYGGAPSGVGQTYEWAGDGNIGEGRIRIAEATADRVVMDMEFIKPFAARNKGEFILTRTGEATEVTWAMSGPSPLISKVMDVVVGFDRMIGPEFEAGLAALKYLTEK